MKKIFIIIAVTFFLTGAGYIFINQKRTTIVTSFEECVAAGNAVLESYPAQCIHEGKTYVQILSDDTLLDRVVSAVKSGDKTVIASLIQFGEFPCTTRDGLGGPPQCTTGEMEGTIIEALPVIDGEGTHIRKGSPNVQLVIKPGTYIGLYRTTDEMFADANFPKGEYAIIVKNDNAPMITYSILHITEGKIIRIDARFGELSLKGLDPIETVTATSADDAPPGSIHNLPVPQAVDEVRGYIAEKEGVSEGKVIVLTAYEKNWSDSCLGLGGPAESCLAAITPGYEVAISVNGEEQKYRTNSDGTEIRREK